MLLRFTDCDFSLLMQLMKTTIFGLNFVEQ